MVTLVLEMLGMPSIIFALGMYLPLELNSPALVGGAIHHFVTKRSERTGGTRGTAMRERGVIIASGLMAGGALGGVAGAALNFFPWYRADLVTSPFFGDPAAAQLVSAALFVALCAYLWIGAMRDRDARA
jgi:hypothetical protein